MNRKDRRIAGKQQAADPDQLYSRALALHQGGRLAEAVGLYRQALRLRPDFSAAASNRAVALAELDRPRDAELALRQALVIAPDLTALYTNLSIIERDGFALDAAIRTCRRALALDPTDPDALNSLGIILHEQGQLAAAAAAYRQALERQPDFAKAQFNLGLVLLAQGDYAAGWPAYHWRWRGGARHLRRRGFVQPEWRGEPLMGRRLLLHAEQGFGDSLQFVRFVAAAAARGARVILEVPAPLARLLQGLADVAELVPAGAPLPAFDVHLPLLSLPGVLGTTLDTLPGRMPYLQADAMAVAQWRQRLLDLPGRKIGLVWAGDPRPHDPRAQAIDRRRSVALSQLAPLLALPGISWVNLQLGGAAAERRRLPAAAAMFDATDQIRDFADSAALVAALDLVITVDTATAHLTGGLGQPVWILSRFDACWRWLQDRDDSPWYPSARLFRQTRPGDWDEVVERVAAALTEAAREE